MVPWQLQGSISISLQAIVQPNPRREQPARDLAKEPKAKEPSFAIVAAAGAKAKGTQEWTLVDNTKSKTQKATKPRDLNSLKSRRLVLISSPSEKDFAFSAIAIRNVFNKAFQEKGVLEPVVAIATKSLNQNLVITTTTSFTADFLLEKKAICHGCQDYANIT